ncbi:hypothetical protein BH10BAC1_BH10BAC1_10460 [soil metagenome]
MPLMAQYFFTHLINPVSSTESNSLFEVQSHTLTSISKAKLYAANLGIQVQNLVCFTKDNACELSPDFTVIKPLERVSSDTINTSKKVPFFNDLLNRLNEFSDADYLIYTNLDICLMPNFYASVKAMVENGHDAIIINRRVISNSHLKHGNIERMYADLGKVHSGYDTFIFKKELFKKFILKNICIGVPPVGSDLFYNLFVFAENPILETESHLTFHIGEDLIKPWGDKELLMHNNVEFKKLLYEIAPLMLIEKFPAANKNFIKRHFKWLMNPTVSYPLMAKTDLKQLGHKRKPKKERDIKGIMHRYYEWMIKKINLE